MGKVHTVCIRCVPTLHRMCVESRVFYPTISQRYRNILEFQAAFSTRYRSVSQCILDGEFVYSVRLHCTECALKQGSFIRQYRSDPAM